jgi:hypothetical protein
MEDGVANKGKNENTRGGKNSLLKQTHSLNN